MKDIDCTLRDLGVRGLLVLGITNLDFLGDGRHALDAADRLLNRQLLGVGANHAAEHHHAIVHGNPDMDRIHARLEIQFVEDALAKEHVAHFPLLWVAGLPDGRKPTSAGWAIPGPGGFAPDQLPADHNGAVWHASYYETGGS